ncbi:MAG: hypothetical protein QM813_10990 [Verrucomicrobiota bacterium]
MLVAELFLFERIMPFQYQSITVVRSLKNILFVLAALAWLPMTSHCRWESVPGFEFLGCVSEANCHGESKPQQSAPEQSGCCSVEKTQYKSDQLRITLPTPEMLAIAATPLCDLVSALPAEVCVGVLNTGPPELPSTWQFSFRTALPARAPSFLS